MIIALKVILGFLGIVLLFLSGRWIFDTEKIAKEHSIQSLNATGSNHLKGDIGGILLAASIFIGLFLYDGMHWMYPAIIILGCVSIVRIISLVTAGYSKQGTIAIGVELLLIGLLIGINLLSS